MLIRHLALLSASLVLCGSAVACTATIQPPQPAPPPPPPVEVTASSMVSAQITGYTTNARGLMDGIVLDDGTQVHFRPHVGTAVLPLLVRGDRVRVIGWDADRAGRRVVEAKTITNVRTGMTVDVASIPDPMPAPHPPALPPGAVVPPEPMR